MPPVKKQPYQSNGTEWTYLSNFTLEPTNLLGKNIVRREDWIKSMWTDYRKYLHQLFINYNRSGQHDAYEKHYKAFGCGVSDMVILESVASPLLLDPPISC